MFWLLVMMEGHIEILDKWEWKRDLSVKIKRLHAVPFYEDNGHYYGKTEKNCKHFQNIKKRTFLLKNRRKIWYHL